jgi:hypothetical protein
VPSQEADNVKEKRPNDEQKDEERSKNSTSKTNVIKLFCHLSIIYNIKTV